MNIIKGLLNIADLLPDFLIGGAGFSRLLRALLNNRLSIALRFFQLFPGLLQVRSGCLIGLLEIGHGAGNIKGHALARRAHFIQARLQLVELRNHLDNFRLEINLDLVSFWLDLAHEAAGHQRTELPLLLLKLALSLFHLCLRIIQLLLRVAQAFVGLGEDFVVQIVDLFAVELDLHALFHRTDGDDAGHALLSFKIWHELIIYIFGKFVDVVAVPAHGQVHGGDHIHADFKNAGGSHHVGKRSARLLHCAGNLDHGAVHIRPVFEFQLCHGEILGTDGIDVFHMRNRAQRPFHRFAYSLLHPLRARAGVRGDDDHIRQIH